MKPVKFRGLTLNAPLDVQKVDKGDPNKTMDDAEKFLEKSFGRLYDCSYEYSKYDRCKLEDLVQETSKWIGWFRHQYSILGDSMRWDEMTQKRFIALRGWCESFYSLTSVGYEKIRRFEEMKKKK